MKQDMHQRVSTKYTRDIASGHRNNGSLVAPGIGRTLPSAPALPSGGGESMIAGDEGDGRTGEEGEGRDGEADAGGLAHAEAPSAWARAWASAVAWAWAPPVEVAWA
jgi:hypothetical protein